MKKEEFVTKRYLDKKLEEHSKTIIEAVDNVLEKRLKSVHIEISEVSQEVLGVKQELKETKEELKKDINNVQILIDGYVKAQEEFKQEFVIMKEEVKQIKKVIKQKLGIEIKAI